MKITKSKVEIYRLRDNGRWADITIDENGNAGRISIASDWGSWQYFWGSCGCPFKEFLIGLKSNIHYVADKMGADNYLDKEATIKGIRSYINDNKEYFPNRKEMLLEVDNISEEDWTDSSGFYQLINSTNYLVECYDWIEVVKTITPQFRGFWKEAFIPFLESLQAEAKSKRLIRTRYSLLNQVFKK